MPNSLEIHWPDHYQPSNCPVHVRNEMIMTASQEHVWAWLTHATLWHTWYANSSHVKIIEGPEDNLKMGTRFKWKTFGVRITSTVLEYIPGERIAWDGHALGLDVYHAWVLQPSAQGCHVLTEETQHGWLPRLSQLFMPNRMYDYHQLWLESLAAKSKSGAPQSE